jgi:hypothetical protein
MLYVDQSGQPWVRCDTSPIVIARELLCYNHQTLLRFGEFGVLQNHTDTTEARDMLWILSLAC